jgi:hypothetical protein
MMTKDAKGRIFKYTRYRIEQGKQAEDEDWV